MKSVLLFGLSCFALACSNQHNPADSFRLFGAEISDRGATSVREVLTSPSSFEGSVIVVEGTIGSVCQNKGCWMYITEGGSRIRVTFKDYAFFVPFDSEGKRVRAEGVVLVKVVPEETLKHWEEEEKGGDPSRITGDQHVVMLEASGVLIEGAGDYSTEQLEAISAL